MPRPQHPQHGVANHRVVFNKQQAHGVVGGLSICQYAAVR
jgi:hypothetical protein